MINNNENTLSIIRTVATSLIPGCKIMLFGSRARKDNSMDSDYDFLVIVLITTYFLKNTKSLGHYAKKALNLGESN